jgi:hypothetical protein
VTANTAGSYPNCCQPGGDTVSLLLNVGGGAFASPLTQTVGQTPFSVVIGDVNGDGLSDIATANWHSNDAAVLLGLTAP